MDYSQHGDSQVLVVDPVDDPISATPRTVAIRQRWMELLAQPMGVVQQWPDDEFMGSDRNRLRQCLR
jgi:hypothetical protein